MTKFKTAAGWGADAMKAVETKVKSAFTRSFNKAGLPVRTTIMNDAAVKKGAGKAKAAAAAAADDDDAAVGGELAEVRHRRCARLTQVSLCGCAALLRGTRARLLWYAQPAARLAAATRRKRGPVNRWHEGAGVCRRRQ